MTETTSTPHGRFLDLDDVRAETSLSKTTIYRLMKRKEFPLQRRISPRRVAWSAADIAAWKDRQPVTAT